VLFLFALNSAGNSSGGNSITTSNDTQPKSGWLCDLDGTGSVRLWSAASMQATVIDVVGTCIDCCVDATMDKQTTSNSILFYLINVGGQSGWVDVEYFYLQKPSWASN
jgi:hypothetical protein